MTERKWIVNARIFDGENEELFSGSISVLNGIIEQVLTKDEAPIIDEQDVVIDAQGRVLTPGMIDCHVHALLGFDLKELPLLTDWEIGIRAAKSLESMLQRGFTTVRDAGGLDGSIARCVDKGLISGPRVFPSGKFISQTCGHFDMTLGSQSSDGCQCHNSLRSTKGAAYVADGVDQVLYAARDNLKCGSTQIKIAVSGGVASPFDPIHSVQYTSNEVKAAVDAASNWGTYVMAHCYNDQGAKLALDAGVKSIEHGHMLSEEIVMRCKRENVVVQTQWVVYWAVLSMGAQAGMSKEQIAKAQVLQEGLDRIGSLLRKHEILTGFGTDLIGPIQHLQNKEFTLRKKHFSNFEVLKQATSESASIVEMCGHLNKYPKLGVIRPGAAADVLIHESNPLDDVSVMENPETQLKFIMRSGQIFKNTL